MDERRAMQIDEDTKAYPIGYSKDSLQLVNAPISAAAHKGDTSEIEFQGERLI